MQTSSRSPVATNTVSATLSSCQQPKNREILYESYGGLVVVPQPTSPTSLLPPPMFRLMRKLIVHVHHRPRNALPRLQRLLKGVGNVVGVAQGRLGGHHYVHL
mmetsp:Transcript_36824/g.59550  ORF Transcript_36824/g.59550 Transcript_36824/m.59550 type:complete len:103 (-) Transcript_36824:1108-1416(-)